MLYSIYSNKFKSNNEERGVIHFNKGLNTIVGTNSATNSIGKTTFLLIIDFVFGGDDYISNADNTVKEIGHHEFIFEFKFNEKIFKFSRNTQESNKVYSLSDSFNEKIISITQYREFLKDMYKISNLSFRDLVSGYFRIYNRENHFEKEPLKSYKNETKGDSIQRLIKTFNEYEKIKYISNNHSIIKSKINALKVSSKFNFIHIPSSKKKLKELKIKIDKLEDEKNELKKSNLKNNINVEKLETDKIYIIKKDILENKKLLNSLENKLEQLKIKKDYVDLIELFPEINISKLEELDDFHNNLNKILNKEIVFRQKELEILIEEQNKKIEYLENELSKIPIKANISEILLNEFGRIESELTTLNYQLKMYEELYKLKIDKENVENELNCIIKSISEKIENTINNQMNEYNDFVCDNKKTAPILNIESIKKYNFYIPNDTGTGSQFRALIEYDLSLLNKTQLPCIIHDSIILKQTEDEGISKILELYNSFEKQIFIAIDKQNTLPEKARKIIKDTTIISLSPNGNELFGHSWNNKNN